MSLASSDFSASGASGVATATTSPLILNVPTLTKSSPPTITHYSLMSAEESALRMMAASVAASVAASGTNVTQSSGTTTTAVIGGGSGMSSPTTQLVNLASQIIKDQGASAQTTSTPKETPMDTSESDKSAVMDVVSSSEEADGSSKVMKPKAVQSEGQKQKLQSSKGLMPPPGNPAPSSPAQSTKTKSTASTVATASKSKTAHGKKAASSIDELAAKLSLTATPVTQTASVSKSSKNGKAASLKSSGSATPQPVAKAASATAVNVVVPAMLAAEVTSAEGVSTRARHATSPGAVPLGSSFSNSEVMSDAMVGMGLRMSPRHP